MRANALRHLTEQRFFPEQKGAAEPLPPVAMIQEAASSENWLGVQRAPYVHIVGGDQLLVD